MNHIKSSKITLRFTILLIIGWGTHVVALGQQTVITAEKRGATRTIEQSKIATDLADRKEDTTGTLFLVAVSNKDAALKQLGDPAKQELLDEKTIDIFGLRVDGFKIIEQEIFKPNASELTMRAKKELLQGDLDAASRLLKQLAALQGSASLEQLQKAATIAKQDGALWIARDSQQAIASFELAHSYQNDDMFVLDTLIRLYKIVGKNDLALKHAQTLVFFAEHLLASAPTNNNWHLGLCASLNILADVLQTKGQLDKALALYKRSLDIREKLAANEPKNSRWEKRFTSNEWQYELSVNRQRIADILEKQGHPLNSLHAEPAKSIKTRKKLAAHGTSDTTWQSYLWVDSIKLISMSRSQGRIAEALSYSQHNLAAFEKLATSDPSNNLLQRDLSANLDNVAGILQTLGQRDKALDLYQKSLTVRENLAAREPKNSAWQANLVASYVLLSNLHPDPVNTDMVRKYLTSALAIAKKLSAAEALNDEQKGWPADLQKRVNDLR
jgi:tetratricopeptide (TPR) repeat protein